MANEQRHLRVEPPNTKPELRQFSGNIEANIQELFQIVNGIDRRVSVLEAAVNLNIASLNANIAAIAALDVRVTAHEVAYP